MAPSGALEAWLMADRMGSKPSYITAEEKSIHQKIFQGEYGPAMNWYKVFIQNLNEPDETATPLEPKLTHPVLMVNASKDMVGLPVAPEEIAPFTDNLEITSVATGHWMQLEAKDEVNEILETFFKKVLS